MIELKSFTRSDYPKLIDWVNEESPRFMLQWGGGAFDFPLDEKQLDDYMKPAETENPGRMIFKAYDTDRDETVGHIELNHIDRKNQSAVISRVLVGQSRSRNKGIGSAMISEIVKIGFEELQLHRIELRVYDFNERAIACYEKAGFKKEGLLSESKRFKDEYWNTYVMAILRSEWVSSKQ
ncbi:GNAT family N-acetyltransferase [Pseudalkalibacillus caeni]|uniref:GNAT family N-acetyltransferase n=1 Tax=Exobacillus caeni TaxID=2574798 RepID=A0A5R9F8V8_9BACL|nr:GNAT family protein [Pseudalkalibacillus caeni]TLS38756.1 GNAT family N-acetyltransferase [Pseudalkalibacillus caeni]